MSKGHQKKLKKQQQTQEPDKTPVVGGEVGGSKLIGGVGEGTKVPVNEVPSHKKGHKK